MLLPCKQSQQFFWLSDKKDGVQEDQYYNPGTAVYGLLS